MRLDQVLASSTNQARLLNLDGTPCPQFDSFSILIDEGSTGLPGACTGFIDIRTVLALGLRLDTSVRYRIATADPDAGNTHRAFGKVRVHLEMEGHALGIREYIVSSLPGSRCIFGSQVDTKWYALARGLGRILRQSLNCFCGLPGALIQLV